MPQNKTQDRENRLTPINNRVTNNNKAPLDKVKKNKNAPHSSPGSQPPNKKQKTQQ